VTPNLAEAAALTGVRVRDEADLPRVAAAVLALGPRWVLLKGGHLEGDAVDLLTDGDAVHEFRAARVQPGRARGTGCALASALACRLAFGCDVPTAAALAKSFVRSGIERSYRIGRGEPVLGTSSFLSRTSLTPHDGRR
jgi:hydroxymethylpyrimidine/phosphomethylpyrimidine kinase